jgi:hypothetical protein
MGGWTPPPWPPPTSPGPGIEGNGMATTSLVMGICSLVLPLLSIPGFILGLVSLRRIRRQPWLPGRGRSIGGIITSVILGPLAVIVLVPTFLGVQARHHPTATDPIHRGAGVPATLSTSLAVPTSCGVPSSIGSIEPAGPTAAEGAAHFANLVARNKSFLAQVGVPANQFSKSFDVTTETPSQALSDLASPLVAAATSLAADAEAFDGPNSHAVVATEIEQFPNQEAAIAYDQAIFSYDCQMGRSMFSVPSLPAAFGTTCGCTDGTHYLEVSMVIGKYRVGVDDYSSAMTPDQVNSWAETVAEIAKVDYPGI